MLIITFHNDSTGNPPDEIGNYDYTVYVNKRKIHAGRIEGHDRSSGWEGLVSDLVNNLFKDEI